MKVGVNLLNLADKFYNVFAHLGEHDANDREFIVHELHVFMNSKKREDMLSGEKYYVGNHDILNRERMAIGQDGKLEAVENLPNNKIIDNQYSKLVNQKVSYLLGKPLTFTTENDTYNKVLGDVLDRKFLRTMKQIAEDSLNCGIGWMLVHYDENGEIQLKRINPIELIPGWKDAAHTILDYAIRLYPVIECEGNNEKIGWRVEVFDRDGIHYFEYEGTLKPCEPYFEHYFTRDEQGYGWDKIPLVAFKYNSKEIPLINRVKSLQDGLNVMLSDFENNMQEDSRNTILVLQNYDGENLGEFRRNLSTYGAVKIRSTSETHGGVSTLKIDVNPENYRVILSLLKNAIIENGFGYDAKDERMSGNPNQMNIQSMYSDIDLDAGIMEAEFQASLEQLLWFINAHLANTGQGDFEGEKVQFIFNRDILINEGESISNLRNSVGILSSETLIAQHPWVDNPREELERIKAERTAQQNEYMNAFGGEGGEK